MFHEIEHEENNYEIFNMPGCPNTFFSINYLSYMIHRKALMTVGLSHILPLISLGLCDSLSAEISLQGYVKIFTL